MATTEKSGGRTDAIGTARSTGRSETATTTIDLGTDGADRTIRGTGDSIGTGHGHDVDRWQTDAPTTTDGPGDSEPAREDDRRCQACGRPHTAGDASDDGRETSSSTSIRRETDTTPDEDVVPDGETDPFVATADESGTEAGTLERIRDLL